MTFKIETHRAVGKLFGGCGLLIVAVVVSLVLSATAQAAPGDLDPTFSDDGLQTTPFLNDAQANDVAIQANGKIVAVGSAADNSDPYFPATYFGIARYKPDGSLDPTFSGDGLQTTGIAGFGAHGVAIQGDGKIVAVGSSTSGFALARYNPGGKLDRTFSGDGKQRTNFGYRYGGGSAVAIQANGKIVVVGNVNRNHKPNFAVARYNANGSLDKTFSGDGRQLTPFHGAAYANDVAIQGKGKIVALGTTYTPTADNAYFALARYNPNGTLDKSFSGDGKQTTDFRSPYDPYDEANGVALQGSGRIVAVGVTSSLVGDEPNLNFALARYNANGSLDKSFSGDGKQTTDLGGCCGGNDVLEDVAVQPDGKIVAVGVSTHLGYGLARYTFHGSLDPTFSGDGVQTGGGSAVALQGDAKIVVVGESGGEFALARYLGG